MAETANGNSALRGVGVVCGNCGGPILMATCDHFRGTGHEWVIVSICLLCRATHWVDAGCHDCRTAEQADG